MSNLQPIQVPQTTGALRSFGHCRLNLNGVDFTGGFTELKWSIENTSEEGRSNNPDPIGFSLGENKYAASVRLYYDFLMNLIQQVGPGWNMLPFTGYFSFVGTGLVTYTDKLVACRLKKVELDTTADNAKPITMPIDLGPIKIYPAGVDGNIYPLIATP
jgi:hypothetical protein